MGFMERLHLRWNDFEPNIKLGFSELRQDEDFYDVTLACESKQVKAHKVILSACSPFFRSLIKSVSHAHPLLYLRGIKFSHLEALLSFMYNGEVSVTQEELTEFLSIAKELKIRGLTQEGSSSSSSGAVVHKEETPTPPPNKRPRLNHKPASNAPSLIKPGSSRDPPEPISSDDIEILAPIKAEHSQSLSQQSSSSKHAPPSYDTEFHEEKHIPEDEESANFPSRVEDGMEAEEDVDFLNTEEQHSSSYTSDHPTPIAPMNENEGSTQDMNAAFDMEIKKCFKKLGPMQYGCMKCNYRASRRSSMMRHVECNHFVSRGFPCGTCGFLCKTRPSLRTHIFRRHKKATQFFPVGGEES
uniref:Broad-complex core protein isoform 6 n=1 Tax=Caligus rogercresseyi TaxID=217165 RepID=C1BPP2_CALRO|nr:Broad-complex core protein isoform 6 [Caligus rogercresseyi]